MNIFQD